MNVPDTGAQDMTEIQMKAPFDTEARGFTSLRRPDNLPDEIAHQIRQRILNGSLAHGQRLPTEHELATAFDAWDPETEATPFESDAYQLEELDRAEEALSESELLVAEAADANQNGDNYVLTAALLALVLFFAGISNSLRTEVLRTVTLLVAGLVFLVGVGLLISFPVG